MRFNFLTRVGCIGCLGLSPMAMANCCIADRLSCFLFLSPVLRLPPSPENAAISSWLHPSIFILLTILFIGILSFFIFLYLSNLESLRSICGPLDSAPSAFSPLNSAIKSLDIPSIRILFTILTKGIPTFFIFSYLANSGLLVASDLVVAPVLTVFSTPVPPLALPAFIAAVDVSFAFSPSSFFVDAVCCCLAEPSLIRLRDDAGGDVTDVECFLDASENVVSARDEINSLEEPALIRINSCRSSTTFICSFLLSFCKSKVS
mmetsp:Transcript_26982/g.44258  ORF Transcript_26982/g.44258 Transcript_26982/m.44258 type:complete len:262 (-) Transcript_26982:471-1256(-)